ncbi:hypothetical protein [Paenibacillus sp. 203]|uniref:hypothetical protein n=1 Tax=Paenibacillus sp. 203 TaxID=3096765 RepID=UPI001F41E43A
MEYITEKRTLSPIFLARNSEEFAFDIRRYSTKGQLFKVTSYQCKFYPLKDFGVLSLVRTSDLRKVALQAANHAAFNEILFFFDVDIFF